MSHECGYHCVHMSPNWNIWWFKTHGITRNIRISCLKIIMDYLWIPFWIPMEWLVSGIIRNMCKNCMKIRFVAVQLTKLSFPKTGKKLPIFLLIYIFHLNYHHNCVFQSILPLLDVLQCIYFIQKIFRYKNVTDVTFCDMCHFLRWFHRSLHANNSRERWNYQIRKWSPIHCSKVWELFNLVALIPKGKSLAALEQFSTMPYKIKFVHRFYAILLNIQIGIQKTSIISIFTLGSSQFIPGFFYPTKHLNSFVLFRGQY